MKKLFALLCGLTVGLGVAELALRYVPSAIHTRVVRDEYVATRAVLQNLFGEPDADSRLGFHMKPGAKGIFANREFHTSVRFNSLGLRGPEVPAKKTGRRILVLGDSMTVGWGVEEGDTFTTQMARERPRWQFINAGVSGYGTVSESTLLERLGKRLKPDDILVVFYPNDPIESSILPRLGKSTAALSRWDSYYVARASRILLHQFLEPSLPYPYYFGTNAEMWQKTQTALRDMRDWAAGNKSRIGFVYMPLKDEMGEEMPVGYRKKFLEDCRFTESACLDLTPALQHAARFMTLYFKIDEHLTPVGHRVVARTISEWLEKSGSQKPETL